MSTTSVAVLGTGLTDLSCRDLDPSTMAVDAARQALADAAVQPEDLALVVVGNALGGRLCDQGCLRGQSWLLDAALGDVPVVNVDNSCAGGSSAVHLGVRTAQAEDRPVLVLGVEKMWTGDRQATLAGIEDGLPAPYRAEQHRRLHAREGGAATIMMALNDDWAQLLMTEHGATVEHLVATAVKARRHASLNPKAQFRRAVSAEEVRSAPTVAGVLTRLMCSSFTDGAAAMVLAGPDVAATKGSPVVVGSLSRSGNGELEYHDRLARTAAAAWECFGFGPDEVDLVELHDATSPEELFSLEALGFFGTGEAGPATLAGTTTVGGGGLAVNPSGGLVGRGHPIGATGIAQLVELADQLRGRAGERQVPRARLGVAVNTGGVVGGDAGFVGMHAMRAGG